jgi:dipeptidyl aminopeptidase/acylaminoacyl peptidase
MKRDLRGTELYREILALHTALRAPGSGQVSDAADVNVSPDGSAVVFAGTLVDQLEGTLPTRICRVDLASSDLRVLTFGPHVDRLPQYCPDGRHIAFLSDRHQSGDFQLYLLNPDTYAVRPTPRVPGWVEYLQWSPDGSRILVGVAGHGADRSGGQGAIPSALTKADLPAWTPTVDGSDEAFRRRSVWLYDLTRDLVEPITAAEHNIWETVWCGADAMATVQSTDPSEGAWYTATLHLLDLRSGQAREVYRPHNQIGCLAASPQGTRLAWVEAVCSDRGFIAGDLLVTDTHPDTAAVKSSRKIDTQQVDVTTLQWRSERYLLLVGYRGFQTVVGLYDCDADHFTEVWARHDITTGGIHVSVSGCGEPGDCVLLGENFSHPPEVARIRRGEYVPVKRLGSELQPPIDSVDRICWTAPDGLEIQGWLLRPRSPARDPFPLVMEVHGGPVWHWRPRWLGRSNVHTWMLLSKGFAVFLPNPRGSSGRGQDYASRVKGDLNGADTQDLLSGLDHLIARGIADPQRLGVTGGSYGGNMTAWLITQDSRFAAAIPVAPHTNQVSEHLVSNIPSFVALFLDDHYTNPGGKYFTRSPIMHAHKVKTPTLNICGALDRCTPPEEAVQFHNALRENGVPSLLVTYPQEGHGIRSFPAIIDYATRVISWFATHLR